jgi:uncharacterized membrane protein
MRKFFTAIIFSTAIAGAAFAQTGQLRGNVYENKSNKPVGSATIIIYNQDKVPDSMATDMKGNYSMLDVKPGKYKITAKADGYDEKTKENVSVKADKISFVDFYLDKSKAK